MVSGVTLGTARNGKPFVRCKLFDRTGTINAKMWDYSAEKTGGLIKDGAIIQVWGRVDEYNGALDVTMTMVGTAVDYATGDFEKCSKYDPKEMWGKFERFIEGFGDTDFGIVAKDLFSQADYKERFCLSPAATNVHHAYKHGLLEHTLQMLEMGEVLLHLDFFEEVLNKDLCMFGLMFHDFGKIFEYSAEPGFKKTTQGILVGHIPMMAAKILESCNKFGVREEIRDYMMHVVLAHHRQLDWGSPVTPACPEASFVHFVDNLHADVFQIVQKVAESKEALVKNFGQMFIKKQFNEVANECVSEAGGKEAVVGGF
jgi:3'-5' exoribonuclease